MLDMILKVLLKTQMRSKKGKKVFTWSYAPIDQTDLYTSEPPERVSVGVIKVFGSV